MRTVLAIAVLLPVMSMAQTRDFDPTGISRGVMRTVERIAELGLVSDESFRVWPEKSTDPYREYNKLRIRASIPVLIALSDHPSPAVRLYTFKALKHRASQHLMPILLAHLGDTSHVRTQLGYLVGKSLTIDLMIAIASEGALTRPDGMQPHPGASLAKADLAVLDSMLIFTPNVAVSTTHALNRAKRSEALHHRLRELCSEGYHTEALVRLANFRRQEDILFILDSVWRRGNVDGSTLYRAIEQFSDEAFLPLLRRHVEDAVKGGGFPYRTNRDLYTAVAAFKNKEALELLSLPQKSIKDPYLLVKHMGAVFDAIEDHPDAIYDDLLWRMTERFHLLSPLTLQHLAELDPGRACLICRANVNKASLTELANGFRNSSAQEMAQVWITTFDLCASQDSLATRELVRTALLTNAGSLLPVAIRQARQLPGDPMVGTLLSRLREEEDMANILLLGEDLLTRYQPEIDQQIQELRDSKSQEGGCWSEVEVDLLLRKYGLF